MKVPISEKLSKNREIKKTRREQKHIYKLGDYNILQCGRRITFYMKTIIINKLQEKKSISFKA